MVLYWSSHLASDLKDGVNETWSSNYDLLYSYGTPCCPSLPRHINGYWQDDAQGNSVVGKHLPQGMVEKLPVSTCSQNWDKLWPSGTYWLLCRLMPCLPFSFGYFDYFERLGLYHVPKV